MTTVRELRHLLFDLDQDAEIFIAVPTRDHWETVNRTEVGELLAEGHMSGGRKTEYALTFGEVKGNYNTQNLYDGLLWVDDEEEDEPEEDDEDDEDEQDFANVVADTYNANRDL